jgi:hypothetical protein
MGVAMSDADRSAKRQRGRPFQPGQSGNPAGRPKGWRSATTRLVEDLLDGEAEELTRKAIELAKAGDAPVLRMVLERIAPARKDGPISFELPPIATAADAKTASSAVLAAVAGGEISPSEGTAVMALLVSHKMIVEATEFETRLAALEARKQ